MIRAGDCTCGSLEPGRPRMTNRSYFAARSMVGHTTCRRDGFIDLLRKSATVLRCTFGDVYAFGEDRRRAYPAAMSTTVQGSSFRWGDAVIFFEEEFDLLDAFIGEGQDP